MNTNDGNKGIVSLIEDDDRMPVNEFGERADVVLNPLGVLNRLNISQWYEQHLNFIGRNVVRKLKDMDDMLDMEDLFFPVMKDLQKKQYDFLYDEYIMMNRNEKEEFWEDIIENGIYFHEPPFYGGTTFNDLVNFKKKYPDISKRYKFDNIEKEMIMGDMYFIRLKHESSNKTSARATSLNNIKKLPAKSTLKKEKKSDISNTPIRFFGEMESSNILISNRPDILEKMFKTLSTSEEDRVKMVREILMADNPLKLNISLTGSKSINRQILDKYLNVLDLKIED